MAPLAEREPQRPDWRGFLDRYAQAWERYSQNPTRHNLHLLQTGEEILMRELVQPGRFPLGQLAMTPGAQYAMADAGHIPPEFLIRHKMGDWGELDAFDREQNERALLHGSRLLSAYDTRLSERLWVITEADRASTTMLLPQEY